MPKDAVIEIPEDQLVSPTSRAAQAPKTHYRLDGLAITIDGKVTKTKIFEFLKLDPSDYSDLTMTAEEAEMVTRSLRHLSTGLNAIVPIFCGGEEKCVFKQICPFIKIGKPPVLRPCYVEKQLITTWTVTYMEEFQVDPSNLSEMSLIMELAELDIYDWRATFQLHKGSGPTMLQEQMVAVDENGRPIYNKVIHQAWEVKERIKRRKMQVLESLVGTRREKYKRDAALKRTNSDDPSNEYANLRARLDNLTKMNLTAAGLEEGHGAEN